MMLLLAKKNPCSILLPFFAANRFCCASATQNPDPKPSIFRFHDYLVTSWGFSPDKAATFSKRLPNIKSPEKPDAVLRFLIRKGFSMAEIQKLVTWRPSLFNSCPETTLEPNLNALRGMGLSTSTLNKIILTNPGALQLQSAMPRINFWLDFFGGNEVDLVKAFKQNKCLLDADTAKNIQTKISFLQSHGLSTHDIQRIVHPIPRFISYSIALMEKLLERAKELGFHPESGMFVPGLQVVSSISREGLQKKMEILRSFGWSEEEFFSALRKTPSLGSLSEENLRAKMSFLLAEASCDLSYITSHPLLLKFCLDKRLRPRQHVLHLLDSNGLSSKRRGNGFICAMSLTDSKFVEKYILPHKNLIPELHEVYLLPCWKVEVGDYF